MTSSSAANTKCQKKYLRKTLKNITKNDPSTSKVVLNGYNLEDEKIATLAMSLVTNCHVQILYLSQCGITAKGAYLLAFALRKNRSLEHLWLNGNKIGSVGAEAIAAALFENKTLMTLGLANNSIGNRGGKKLVEAVRENESITDIFLEGNRMNKRLVDEINRIVDGEEDEEEVAQDQGHHYMPSSREARKRPVGADKFIDLDDSTVTASVSPSCVGRMLDAIQEEEEEEDLSNDTGMTHDETDYEDEDDEESNDLEYLKCMSELDQIRRKKSESKMARLRDSLTKFSMRVRRGRTSA
ncbi:hypothetical protein ACHAXS_006364 [Conticribra weissflogii]